MFSWSTSHGLPRRRIFRRQTFKKSKQRHARSSLILFKIDKRPLSIRCRKYLGWSSNWFFDSANDGQRNISHNEKLIFISGCTSYLLRYWKDPSTTAGNSYKYARQPRRDTIRWPKSTETWLRNLTGHWWNHCQS